MISGGASLPDGPLIGWYGDDFTGSAAVMEVLTFSGLPSVLFLDVPTDAQLARFPGMRGIGIASTARSHSPAWMDQNLPIAFDWLASQAFPIAHYKVCSTLDSSPEIGSIGKAIDLAAPRFGGWIPCLIAAPAIRRYQAFGHLFAAATDGVFRLDRHPVMARHPVTPMAESDVARHLSQQTIRQFGAIDLEALHGDPDASLAAQRGRGAEVFTLDTVSEADECRAGQLIWGNRDGGLFAVGSQGLEYALVAYWRAAGLLGKTPPTSSAGPAERVIAVSGSVSAVTAAQIDWAETHGFAPIPLDAAALVRGEASALQSVKQLALKALSDGKDPVVFSAKGPDDAAVAAQRAAVSARGLSTEDGNALIGTSLGRLLAELLSETGIKRAVISGGDTSGHACRELDIFAFTALAPTIPGAALLQAHSDTSRFDGLQLALKGGQMGSPDYFGWIKRGGGPAIHGGMT